jgi:hypothetical protein
MKAAIRAGLCIGVASVGGCAAEAPSGAPPVTTVSVGRPLPLTPPGDRQFLSSVLDCRGGGPLSGDARCRHCSLAMSEGCLFLGRVYHHVTVF